MRGSMNNGKILIVEDELLFAADLEGSLEDLGYRVVEKVTNGNEALEMIEKHYPDLIIMDIKLDGNLSGIDTSQIIKDRFNIPVIFLSAHSDTQTIEQAKLTEPFGFLLKPLRIDEVNSMIKTALHKHQIELQLKESETRFRDMTDLLPQPVFEMNMEKKLIFANRSFREYFGYPISIKGLDFLSLFHGEERERAAQYIDNVLDGTGRINCEVQTKDVHGDELYALFYANRIQTNARVSGARGTLIDITERKRAEKKLLTQKVFFEAIFENSPEAIVSINKKSEVVEANSQFEKMFQYSRSEVIGKNINRLLVPEEYLDEAKKFSELAFKQKARLESMRRTKNGELLDTIIVSSPVSVAQNIKFTILIFINISERKKTERELQQIHELYQKTIQNANGVPYRLNLKTNKYEFVGNGLEEILGLSFADFSYEYFKDIKEEVVVHDQWGYEEYQKKFKQGKLEKYQVDFKIYDTKGRERWISDSALPVFNYHEDEVVESIGVLQDITKRKLIEKQLRIERNKIQNYLDVAGVIFLGLDRDLKVNLINEKGCEILGVPQESVLGKKWIDSFLPENIREEAWEFYEHFMNRQIDLFDKRSGYFESKIITKNKEARIILWNNILMRDQDEAITGILCSGIDVTDKVHAENNIKQLNSKLQRKNHDLERIIYVTSHDLRTPLVNIEGFADELIHDLNYIMNEFKKTDSLMDFKEKVSEKIKMDIPDSVGFITNSVAKINSLLSALLQLSRLGRQQLTIEKLNMNELFDNILSTFEYRITRNEIDMKVGNLPGCVADKKQVNQLFSNLIGNALKFLSSERQGKIEIRGRGTQKRSFYYIKDNGIGIKKADQSKIFEIFKRVHKDKAIDGDGLGLSIVRRILEKNNGDIKVESEYGKWTKFTVMLPNEMKAK